jgi:uncharacterized NAD(P)/FAD-binding protein YdhS
MKHVAIVGGGFSGVLQAINLLRHRDARVTLIERGRLASGAAYSTRNAEHLLNVRASGMSAFPEQPRHFADWLAANGGGDADAFAERRLYGRYLKQLLSEAEGERLATMQGDAVDIVHEGGCETVRLADGRSVAADVAILSIGNLAPDVPREIAAAGLPDGVYVADPWAGDIAAGLGEGDHVLLIGTGLTAIDAVLMLDAAGFKGRTLALSRRGLVPRAHAAPAPPVPAPETMPEPRCTSLLRSVRADAERFGWRGAVDRLRSVTQPLWAAASAEERRRFLRHLRPWWDVHRHRIAPGIAAALERMQAEGRLELGAGKLVLVHASGNGALVRWRPRSSGGEQEIEVRRIVNCTGPQGNVARAGEPLLANLVAAGRIRPDVCRIGIDVDERLRTVGADGLPSDSLYAIGPMTRGALWEIVAVPDLRVQVDKLARRLA